MKVKDLHPQKADTSPHQEDPPWNQVEHLCESCGRWALLTFFDGVWMCSRCRQKGSFNQKQLDSW